MTSRSRDNFPNPSVASANPYVPENSPAISDLFELFDFKIFDRLYDHPSGRP